MSNQNVEIVRSSYEAFARDEFPMEVIDPEVEYVNPVGAVEEGTRHGLPAFRVAVEKVFEGRATWPMEPEQLTAVGTRSRSWCGIGRAAERVALSWRAASLPCSLCGKARSCATSGFTSRTALLA
jgi:hypothetical protein